jgi:hypothetical protein
MGVLGGSDAELLQLWQAGGFKGHFTTAFGVK